MRIACYPGSFDPITNGHIEIVTRALKLFDRVVVIIADNIDKKYFFDSAERELMARRAFEKISDRVDVVSTSGLVVDKAKELGSSTLIRGLRAVTDFEYEFQVAAVNEYIDPAIETIFLMSRREQAFISSSHIKELFLHGTDIAPLVPSSVLKAFEDKQRQRQQR